MSLRFAEEILLLILREEAGDLALVPKAQLDLALAGATLSDLAFENRIDTDLEKLMLVDPSPVGDDLLDPTLARIAASAETRDPEHWLRLVAKDGEALLEKALGRLLEKGILQSAGETDVHLSPGVLRSRRYPAADGEAEQEVRLRIMRILFDGDLPAPRDGVVIALARACGLFERILSREEWADRRERIDLLGGLDPIGRSLAKVVGALAAEGEASAAGAGSIPAVKGLPILGSALAARRDLVPFLTRRYLELGPVFRIRLFHRGFVVLAGPASNRFLLREGRHFLRTREPWLDFNHELGATRVLTSTDGRDHGQLRRAFAPAYSRLNFENHLAAAADVVRREVAAWPSDRPIDVASAMQRIVTEQLGVILTGFSPGEYLNDLAAFLRTLLVARVAKQSPMFLHRRRFRRARRRVEEFWRKVLAAHQPGGPMHGAQDIVSDVLELHRADPQHMPETDVMIWSMGPYLVGLDTVAPSSAFTLYRILKHPDLAARASAEADALFAAGPPSAGGLRALDTTYRAALESLRLHPVVPASPRYVGTGFELAGHRIPAGETVLACPTVTHFLPDFFPSPERFDIDRYLPERAEHKQRDAFVPFGVGTHRCLGAGFAEAQILLNLATILREAELVLEPPAYELRAVYAPSLRPRGLKVRLVRRRQAPAKPRRSGRAPVP